MTNEQLTFISGIIIAVLVFLANRSSASTTASFGVLSGTIETLRNELSNEKKIRKEDSTAMQKIIDNLKLVHNTEMKQMEERFEKLFDKERRRYTVYIKKLLVQLRDAKIKPVEWDTSDDAIDNDEITDSLLV